MIRQSLFFGIMFFFFVLTGLILVDKAKQTYARTQGFEAKYFWEKGRYLFAPTDANYNDTIERVPGCSIQMVDPISTRIQWVGKLFSVSLSLLALTSFLIQRKNGHRGAGYWISFVGSFLMLREFVVLGSMFLTNSVPCQEASFYYSVGISENWWMIKLVAGGAILVGIVYSIMMFRLLDKPDRKPVFLGGVVGTLLAAIFWLFFFGEWVLG